MKENSDIREESLKKALSLKVKNILLQFPTGLGKSRTAIEICRKWKHLEILIVVPRRALFRNWENEMKKWDFHPFSVDMCCYAGIHKIAGNGKKYDAVIWDEAHHVSDRVMMFSESIQADRNILLSATVTYDKLRELRDVFQGLYNLKVKLKDVLDSGALPTPEIVLFPLIMNSNERKMYLEISKEVTKLERQFKDMHMQYKKAAYLRACGKRLEILAEMKLPYVKKILLKLEKFRTITFCYNIDHSEALGANCIHSKNIDSLSLLEKFNLGEVDHITACNMLNEGQNLVNCQVGIISNLNSSQIIGIQRVGRCLRHPKPKIIIPYFVDSRDRKLLDKFLKNYNKNFIRCKNINKI